MISECDRRLTFEETGLLDASQRVAARLSLTQGAARSLLRQAKALRGMPKVAAAQAAGELGSRQAQMSPSAPAPEQDDLMMSLGNPP